MSQLSFEQQVRGVVRRANFSDAEINSLVADSSQIDVPAVEQCVKALQFSDSATPRDVQNAEMVLGSIARLRRIDLQRVQTERDVRQRALVDQAARPLNSSTFQ